MVICASTSAVNKAQQQFEANRWVKNISEIVLIHEIFLQRQHALKKMFLTKPCLTLKRPSTKNNAYFITWKSLVQKLLSFLQHTTPPTLFNSSSHILSTCWRYFDATCGMESASRSPLRRFIQVQRSFCGQPFSKLLNSLCHCHETVACAGILFGHVC